MKPRRYNLHLPASGSRNMQLAHSLGLDASQTASPLEGERESFSLDILSHRIPWQVGLHQSLPPLCQPGTVSCNIVLPVDGFSSTRRFQNLGQKRVQFSVTFLNEATRPVLLIVARQPSPAPSTRLLWSRRLTKTSAHRQLATPKPPSCAQSLAADRLTPD